MSDTTDKDNQGRVHCVKSVQIRSYFWSIFSCIRTEIQERFTIEISVLSPNTGKYGLEITPYLDTFHTVKRLHIHIHVLKKNMFVFLMTL